MAGYVIYRIIQGAYCFHMKQGALAILPLAIGAALYGVVFGVLAAQAGFPWWAVGLMSATVHAGSSQIAAVEQIANASSVFGAALAGVALNLRYIGIVASLSELLFGLRLWIKLCAIHMTGDENWALIMAARAKSPEIGAGFLIGSGLVMITVWMVSTAAGARIGVVLPDLKHLGLGFAFTAAFIAMARGLWPGRRKAVPWVVSFAVAGLATWFGLPKAYAIMLGALSGLPAAYAGRRALGVPT